MKKRILALFLAVSMVFAVTGCSGSDQTSESSESSSTTTTTTTDETTDPIVIGTLLPRSGSIALFGQSAWAAFDIARQMVNENGGINGRMIEFADADAPDASAAATEAERLISQEGVNIIIGSIASGNALAASAIAERNGVIYWETTGVTDELTEKGYEYVFRTNEKSSYRGETAINTIANELPDYIDVSKEDIKLAIVAEDSAYGQGQAKAALAKADEVGLNVVINESYSAAATDLSSLVLKLKDSDADVLFMVGYINDTNLFWKQAKQYGLKFKAVIGGGSGYTDPSLVENNGDLVNGFLNIDTPTGITAENFEDPEVTEALETFRTKFLEQYGDQYNNTVHYAAEIAFSGAWILFNYVLPAAGSDDPEAVKAAAEALYLPETVLGYPCEFDENNQNKYAIAGTYQWQGGKTLLVVPTEYSDTEIMNLPLENNY